MKTMGRNFLFFGSSYPNTALKNYKTNNKIQINKKSSANLKISILFTTKESTRFLFQSINFIATATKT